MKGLLIVTLSIEEPICVVIGRTRHRMVLMEIQEAARQGVKFIEVRLDFLARAPDFQRLLENKPCPMLATVRRPVDGGAWKGTEEARQALLRQAIVSGFDAVDIETDIIDSIRRFRDVKRIVSYHNLREVPADLEKIHETMCKQDADIVKVAVRAQSPMDNLRVLNLLKNSPKPTVALCMGDLGMPSRVLGVKFGSPYTYAAFNKERGIAPGLPSYTELKGIYRLGRVNADTQVFGVIGDPVGHSLSPIIHNRAFYKLGINALYVPFRVPRSDLPTFLKEFDSIPVQGYSVTIPHKEAAAALASERDEAVEHIGAANTLIRTENGFKAHNTDFTGVIASLRNNLPPPAKPSEEGETPATPNPEWPFENRAVMILGAGGVARAVAHALKHERAFLTITNRTSERATKLAEEVGCRHVDWAGRHNVLCDVLINCTSVGMQPNMDESPIHHSYLKPGLMVFDTVYTPETTMLVKEARKRGCHVLTGVDLFVRQAAHQFQMFTGQEAPFELMRDTIRRILSPVTIKEEATPVPEQPEEG